jgi:Polyketide cyclase / dehydrase and lipid transport
MFTKSVSVIIDRPIEDVFSFVADARNRPQWDESVDKEELTSPEPIGVGSTLRTTFRSMGREYQYTWEVGEHQPPLRMRVESTSGPFPTTLGFMFSERDGGTSVDASVTGRPTGLMRLLQPIVARTTQQKPRPRLRAAQAPSRNRLSLTICGSA